MSLSKRTVKIYFQANWRRKKLFFGAIFGWTAGFILQRLVVPIVIARAFDKLIEHQGNVDFSMFKDEIGLFVLAALTAQALIDGGLFTLSRLEYRVMEEFYDKIFAKLLSHSQNFHNNSFTGALVNQANRFVSGYVTVTDTFVMSFFQLFVLVVLSSVVLLFLSPPLGVIIITWSLIFVVINYRLTKRRVAAGRERARRDSILTGNLADSISNISAIKATAAEAYEKKAFNVNVRAKVMANLRYWDLTVTNDIFYGILMVLLQFTVLIACIFLMKNGSITAGVLILSQIYITQIINSLWNLSSVLKNLEQSLSDAAEMTEILDLPASVFDSHNAKELRVKNGEITLDHIDFTHADNQEALFKNLSVSIVAGEKVGLVGRSGGGKTTITKLLLRFSDIQGGQILIDGQNIAEVTQESLRKSISYVPQEPLLFHRSLAENISYGKPEASQKEIERVAKMAHAHEFIKDLPQGYDTLVGERGVKLSGGQRQRVAIARAMIKDAPILVLDEATSALDSESELLIQDALWKLMEGRTAIVIAHRLSTIQKMDRIIVMDNGEIVEQGTHKELIAKKGTYADLWKHQSGGFIDE